jgi:hypothetical protein
MAWCTLIGLLILQAASARGDVPVVLENERLRVEFSAKDGAIIRLSDKRAGLELISAPPDGRRPWELLLAPAETVANFGAFRITRPSPGRAHEVALEWDTRDRITVRASARLEAGWDRIEWRCAAENRGDRTILALRSPRLQGIGTLSGDGAADRLLHSTMMGALFFDPFHLFRGASPIAAERGLTASRYPNGFHGSALQMMSYFAEGRGGFYFACQDPEAADKELNFFKSADDRGLVCEVAHFQEIARPGRSLAPGYPVVIAALDGGTWYDAAERYRAWALQQPWCRRGPLLARVARADASRWLLERTGAVGAWWPFRSDIRADILRTRRFYGAPLLHLELWWSHGPSLEAARSEGDHFGPFYFPFLALRNQELFRARSSDAIVPDWTPISPDWVAMCPAQPEWSKVACESAEDLVGAGALRHHQIWIHENRSGCAADCLYYDVGPCAGVPTWCYAPDHAHPPGAGGEITRAYASLIEESRRRASHAKGSYIPVGTECVSEPFVGSLDFYYARNAGFNPDMETFPYVRNLTWLPDGRMEIVPLFPFIYHEHGPVAIQGIYPVDPWRIPEAEPFFAWAEARTVLWGGLLVTFPVPDRPPPSEARTRYLRSLVSARMSFAGDFLAYGRMQRPPQLACGTLAIDHGLARDGWLRRSRFPRGEPTGPPRSGAVSGDHQDARAKELSVEQWATGLVAIPFARTLRHTLSVPAVQCQAYTLGDDRLGLFLVNLRTDAEETVRLPVEPTAYGLLQGTYRIARDVAFSHRSLGTVSGRHEVVMRLGPREFVAVTAVHMGM